jgi:hypothetical protein
MRNLFLAALFLPMTAMAQTPSTTLATPSTTRNTNYSNMAVAATPAPPVAPASPWKISYFVEWQGPALDNLDFRRTEQPGSPPFYSEIDHSFKIGYAVSKNVTIGTQFRPYLSLAPDSTFSFYDQRFYTQWSHMITTSDLDMSGKIAVEIPTSSFNRNAGKIVAFKFDFNFDLKTQLRNWSISFDAMIKPYFYNDPVSGGGKTDLEFGLFPYITLDLSPNVQLLFEGSFDGNHNYLDSFYTFNSAYSDYFDVGPLFTVNSHINTNIALRFFTDEISYKATCIYANIGVAL